MRLITILLVMVVCVAPLLTIEPISTVVATRFESFANLKEDSSFRDRSNIYDKNLSVALSNTLGNGFGGGLKVNEKTGRIEIFVIDSGILDTFFTLGWFAVIVHQIWTFNFACLSSWLLVVLTCTNTYQLGGLVIRNDYDYGFGKGADSNALNYHTFGDGSVCRAIADY